jgi:hypothetical protein
MHPSRARVDTRTVFFGPQFASSSPGAETTALVSALKVAVDKLVRSPCRDQTQLSPSAQVRSIDRCLKLHAALCPPEMRPFHATLEGFFEKNFAGALRR